MKITEVIGYLKNYEEDISNGKFNPVQYLGYPKPGFTYVRDKDTGEVFLVDIDGYYKSDNDMSYGRKPDAATKLTGDYEFYSRNRVYSVGYLVPKNLDTSLSKAFDIKDRIINENTHSDIDKVRLINYMEECYEDTPFGLRHCENKYKWFAEFRFISAERLYEINRRSKIIGQTDTIPYDANIPDNAIYIIITTLNYNPTRSESIDNTWATIEKMFCSEFDVIRFAECDCSFYSN